MQLYTWMYLLKNSRKGIEYILRGLERFLGLLENVSERYGWVMYFNMMLAYSSWVTGLESRKILDILKERGGEKMPLGIRTVLDEMYEKGVQEGIQQGLQQGIQKGIQQGLIIDAQEMVLSAISVKLGYVPEEVEKKIKAETDREKLRELLKEIILAKDILEVLKKYF